MSQSKISAKVRAELTRLKKEEGANVPHGALHIAEKFGMLLRRMTSSNTEAAELAIDLANAAKGA